MTYVVHFFVICITAVIQSHLVQPKKILLEDIRTLTLRYGEWTTSRRLSPVPQLKCIGGTAGCYAFVPQHVQCYNRGSDGYNIQWECKTDEMNKYRFGKIDITCEGYDYADDPYILAGSCGLEYRIDYLSNVKSSDYYSNYDNSPKTNLGSVFGFICVIMIIFFIYRTCFTTGDSYSSSNERFDNNYYPNANAPPPPYGFRPEYQQQKHCPAGQQNGTNFNNNGQPGFFSGMLAGGLLGYLFGNNRSDYVNYQRDWFRSPINFDNRGPSFDHWTNSNSRTSSGFGGTKRR